MQTAGLWRSPPCHGLWTLRAGIRPHLAGRRELHGKGVARVEMSFPRLGAARLRVQGGCRGHLLRSALHTVHRLGEGMRALEDGSLSPAGCCSKGQRTWKKLPSTVSCLSSRWEGWCFHFLPQQMKLCSFLLSNSPTEPFPTVSI